MTRLEKLETQEVEMQETITHIKQETIPGIKQWEPQGGEWFVTRQGGPYPGKSIESDRLFGTEYQTKEQAEWASKQMRKFNRLLCYIAEHTKGIPEDIHISRTVERITYIPFVIATNINEELWAKIRSGELVL